MYYTYVLQSEKDSNYYIGCTGNLEKRLEFHNSGLVRSTKSRIPFKLVYFERYSSLSEARKRENKIKSYKGGNAFKKLLDN